MARPTISAEKKRLQISISLPKEILNLATATDNSSRFFEKSVYSIVAVRDLLGKLRKQEIDSDDFQEDLEDIIDAWDRQFEESMTMTRTSKI